MTAIPLTTPASVPDPLTEAIPDSPYSTIETSETNITARHSFAFNSDQLTAGSLCPPAPLTQIDPSSSVAHTLLVPLDPLFSISEKELESELGQSRSGCGWENWERHLIISELLGPNAPKLLILKLMDIPLKLSKVTFRGSRSVTAIANQIRILIETYTEIIDFAQQAGINLEAPKFHNPEALIHSIVEMWKQCVPSGGNWASARSKGLQAIDIVIWTHDPPRSWFSMTFSRLKEAGILQPRRGKSVQRAPSTPSQQLPSMSCNRGRQTQARSVHTPGPSEPSEQMQRPSAPTSPSFPASPASPAPEAERSSPQPHSPHTTTPGSPHAQNMLREQHAIASALVSLAHAQAEYMHARTLQTRTNVLQQLLGLEQQEQALRLKVAMDVIRITESNDVTRSAAQSWINQTFFTSHPSDDFTRFATAWKAELALKPNYFGGDSICHASSPQVRFPDSLGFGTS
ncbi:hypothetical protein RhiTH_008439 [Rhizoctonia solani]